MKKLSPAQAKLIRSITEGGWKILGEQTGNGQRFFLYCLDRGIGQMVTPTVWAMISSGVLVASPDKRLGAYVLAYPEETTETAPETAPVAETPTEFHPGIRAYVLNFTGKDGRECSVVYDRYGHNADQFLKYGLPQLTSNALGSVMDAYGIDWIETYSVTTDRLI